MPRRSPTGGPSRGTASIRSRRRGGSKAGPGPRRSRRSIRPWRARGRGSCTRGGNARGSSREKSARRVRSGTSSAPRAPGRVALRPDELPADLLQLLGEQLVGGGGRRAGFTAVGEVATGHGGQGGGG